MNRKAKIFTAIGLLLLAAALCLGISNLLEAHNAAKSAENLARSIEERLQGNGSYRQSEIPDYVLNPEKDMPVLDIDGSDCIGVVEIPSLSLKLSVIDKWSYPKLKLSPCRFSGSAYLDNMIVIAHNYPKHFGNLKRLNKGDKVIFTDAEGNVFRYEVTELMQLGPMDTEELSGGKWDLTLLTCTVGGERRVTVRCERTDKN